MCILNPPNISVCLSVGLSVCHTPVFCQNGYTYPQTFSQLSSHTILVFPYQMGWHKDLQKDLQTGAPNARVYEKNHDFRPIYYFISEIMQDRAIVTMEWKANRKPHTSFQMVPVWMTLSDLSPDFEVKLLFDNEYLRNGMRYRHSYNKYGLMPFSRMPVRITFSDLENIKWHDSWASCRSIALTICNKQTDKRTDRRTDEGTGREHYASGQSRLAYG